MKIMASGIKYASQAKSCGGRVLLVISVRRRIVAGEAMRYAADVLGRDDPIRTRITHFDRFPFVVLDLDVNRGQVCGRFKTGFAHVAGIIGERIVCRRVRASFDIHIVILHRKNKPVRFAATGLEHSLV
jgi:hypothetical protein